MFENIVTKIKNTKRSSNYCTAWELRVGNVVYMGAMGIQTIKIVLEYGSNSNDMGSMVDYRKYINSYVYVRVPEVEATKTIEQYDYDDDTHKLNTYQTTLPTKKQLMLYKMRGGKEKQILPGICYDNTRVCIVDALIDCKSFDSLCAKELWIMNHPFEAHNV